MTRFVRDSGTKESVAWSAITILDIRERERERGNKNNKGLVSPLHDKLSLLVKCVEIIELFIHCCGRNVMAL